MNRNDRGHENLLLVCTRKRRLIWCADSSCNIVDVPSENNEGWIADLTTVSRSESEWHDHRALV